jgi:hypothetical protein
VKQILFVVAGGAQWDDAQRIAAVANAPATIVDLGTLDAHEPPLAGTPYPGRHWPAQGYRRVWELTRLLRRHMAGTGVVVLGQDAGRLQRVAVSVARAAGRPVAVVPDGALFDLPAVLPRRLALQERLLAGAGLTAGEPLRFGATRPDLWCAWGPGWTGLLRSFSPDGEVVVTGSPRGADLAAVAPPEPTRRRLLICSQPTWVHPFPASTTAAPTWYRWVDRVLRSAPGDAVGVRLHPRERDIIADLPVSARFRAAETTGRSLADDLGAHDAVVAPLSTALVEAAATGRPVVSVVPDPACAAVRAHSPATADPRLAVHVVDDVDGYSALWALLDAQGAGPDWGHSYAVLAPDAAARCAVALVDVMAASDRR